MLKTTVKTPAPRYRSLFPDWSGPRPLGFFMIENLLEARQMSVFPTNGAGCDEDVNIYLSSLLTDFLGGHHSPQIRFGALPLLDAPPKSQTRRQRADFYRRNAEHRLIMLGLFDRGDHLRRRSHFERQRDLEVGRLCFQMAANLLENRQSGLAGLVDVWGKLAENFDLYVQVLATMASERLGLGACLSTNDLQRLMVDPAAEVTSPSPGEMDRLLDLLLEYRQPGGHKKRAEVIDLALRLNLDPQDILAEAG